MRAIQVHEHGGPEVMRLEEVPDPRPRAGEVRVRVAAAGVNFIDVYFRTGAYPGALPMRIGLEGAGTVDEVGDGVDDLSPGDRVAFAAAAGAYAELVALPAERCVGVPDGVDLETAAASMLQGMTAHYLATDTFPLSDGHTALVHAAAGGVGLLLTQIAKRRGARVIATVSTEEKAALAREAGADDVIRYDLVDFGEEVARLTGGAGLPVVYDSVGRTTFDRSLGCLGPRGYLVLFGQSSGRVEPFDPQRLAQGGSLFLTRPTLAHYTRDREELRARGGQVLEWVRDGELHVRIGEKHALADAATAHERLQGRLTTGKVLLVP
jgi:NADPH2:quinone reductase